MPKINVSNKGEKAHATQKHTPTSHVKDTHTNTKVIVNVIVDAKQTSDL